MNRDKRSFIHSSVSRRSTNKPVNSGLVTLRRHVAPTQYSDANSTVSVRNDMDTAPVNEQTQPVLYSEMASARK